MAQLSAIEWTDATWNPVTGCSKVSPGCAHCYAETLTARFAGRRGYIEEHRPWTPGNAEHNVRLHPERLEQPLRWKKPRMVFVNSMSDLFHELVPMPFLFDIFVTMASARQHVFQVLTKRPEIARDRLTAIYDLLSEKVGSRVALLPHVWIGVSIENARYTWRADVLREIPAAVRFISAEPLLGSLFNDLHIQPCGYCGGYGWYAAGDPEEPEQVQCEHCRGDGDERRDGYAQLDLTGIDWLIAGGESGHEARPMHPDWARELRDAALATAPLPKDAAWVTHGTRFFFKQWGEWAPSEQCGIRNVKMSEHRFQYESRRFAPDGTEYRANQPDLYSYPGMESALRVGKKKAGRLLDGREWNEMPGGIHG